MAERAEPGLPRRGESYARSAEPGRPAQGRRAPSPRRGFPRGLARRPDDPRGDLACRDAALAPASRAPRRARAPGRRGRVHRPDGALPRDPDGAARAVRHPRRVLRRRRADEPARVRGHGHRVQLLPRCRSGRIRPPDLELGGRARQPAGAGRPAGRGGLLGRGPGVLRAAAGREGDRRLLLRLRRQVPARVDGDARRRAVAGAPRRRLLARRARLPRRHRRGSAHRRRPVPVVPARHLRGADQPLPHAALARERRRPRPHAGRSSSPPPARRSSRTRARGSSAGSSRAASSWSSTTSTRRRSRPTARSSTIRPRPRRWAAAPASECSTSTPTGTGQGGCSSSSISESPLVSTELSVEEQPAPAEARGPLAAVRRIAVVPAFNEERNIGRLLAELAALDPDLEVVVVSDGSTDRTAEVAAAAGAHVVSLPFNLGIGGAVQTGFRFAWEGGYELAVRLDGDGQHYPSQQRAIVAPVVADEADLAIGSRFLESGGYRSSAARRFGIRVLARVVSWIARQRLTRTRPRASRPPSTPGRTGSTQPTCRTTTPEVEALVMAIRHPPPRAGGPGHDARARARTLVDRNARLRLLHAFLGQGAFFVFVDLFQLASAASPRRTAMTPVKISIFATAIAVILLLVVFELIRSRRLRERYALAPARHRARARGPVGVARRPEHDRRLARRSQLPARGAVRRRSAVRDHRPPPLLDARSPRGSRTRTRPCGAAPRPARVAAVRPRGVVAALPRDAEALRDPGPAQMQARRDEGRYAQHDLPAPRSDPFAGCESTRRPELSSSRSSPSRAPGSQAAGCRWAVVPVAAPSEVRPSRA